MPHYQYLIIGGGMGAAAAARSIRDMDESASLALISAEPDPPYKRPPLTKGLWTGKTRFESIWFKTDDLERHLGRTIQAIEPAEKRVRDDQGTEYTYDKLLLVTGGRPRRFPFGGDAINYFRTVQDYHR